MTQNPKITLYCGVISQSTTYSGDAKYDIENKKPLNHAAKR